MQVTKPIDQEVEDKIRKQALIFSKETKQPLSDYQWKINEAAGVIASCNPSILTRRGEVLEAARIAVYENGYVFRKGHFR